MTLPPPEIMYRWKSDGTLVQVGDLGGGREMEVPIVRGSQDEEFVLRYGINAAESRDAFAPCEEDAR